MAATRTTNYARTADGAYIGYQTMGAGDTALLVGSYGSISIDSFDEQPQLAHFLDLLASFTRVVLFDWRGVGLSDPLPPTAEPAFAHSPDDILAVVDAISGSEPAPPSMLAWLNAGPTAIAFAAQHPGRLRSLVLANTVPKLVAEPGFEWGMPAKLAKRFDEDIIEPGGSGDGLVYLGVHAPSMIGDEAFVRWWDDGGRRGASPATAHAFMRGLIASDARSLLPQVDVPTLVLHSRENRWYVVEHGRYMAERIPDARLVEVPSADMPIFTDMAEVFVEEIEEFLTGERHVHEPARELMTVLFTDIVDSTKQVSELGDRRWRAVLDDYERLADREVRRHRGRVVKSTGDGLLAVFDSPARAIRCATALTAQAPVPMRAGLHIGEVELRGADIGGLAVHAGQRVSAAAGAGEVLVSRTVAELVAGAGFTLDDRGEHDLRGLPGRWQLFAVTA